MTKVALINSPSPFLIDDKVMPPLGIMYLSSYLKERDISVEIFDLSSNVAVPSGYDVYAFTSTTPQYKSTVEMMEKIKLKNQKSTFVIGGAHATAFKETCRFDGFDCVVVGEGEEAIYSIVRFIERGENSSIHGVINARQIDDIDVIPFPDRKFEGFYKYHYNINGIRATTMITSRGCPFSCYFCCNVWGNKVRLRTAKNVIEEANIIKNMGFGAIQFYDDTFTIDKKRVIEICNGLKELGLVWRCFIHANTVDSNLLRIMQQSGCVEVGIGVESGSNEILKTINKKIDLEKVIKVCNWCHEIGLRIKMFLICGLPGESNDTVDETIEFLRLSKPDDFDYTIYTPFPNTVIWNEKEKFDIIFNRNTLDYSKMFYKGKVGQYCSQIATSELSEEEIESLRDYVDTEIRKEIYG